MRVVGTAWPPRIGEIAKGVAPLHENKGGTLQGKIFSFRMTLGISGPLVASFLQLHYVLFIPEKL